MSNLAMSGTHETDILDMSEAELDIELNRQLEQVQISDSRSEEESPIETESRDVYSGLHRFVVEDEVDAATRPDREASSEAVGESTEKTNSSAWESLLYAVERHDKHLKQSSAQMLDRNWVSSKVDAAEDDPKGQPAEPDGRALADVEIDVQALDKKWGEMDKLFQDHVRRTSTLVPTSDAEVVHRNRVAELTNKVFEEERVLLETQEAMQSTFHEKQTHAVVGTAATSLLAYVEGELGKMQGGLFLSSPGRTEGYSSGIEISPTRNQSVESSMPLENDDRKPKGSELEFQRDKLGIKEQRSEKDENVSIASISSLSSQHGKDSRTKPSNDSGDLPKNVLDEFGNSEIPNGEGKQNLQLTNSQILEVSQSQTNISKNKLVLHRRKREYNAARTIQSAVRMHLTATAVQIVFAQKRCSAATKVQQWFRNCLKVRKILTHVKTVENSSRLINYAILTFQTKWKYSRLRRCVLQIQEFWRESMLQTRMIAAATKIQKAMYSFWEYHNVNRLVLRFKQFRSYVNTIATWWKRLRCRQGLATVLSERIALRKACGLLDKVVLTSRLRFAMRSFVINKTSLIATETLRKKKLEKATSTLRCHCFMKRWRLAVGGANHRNQEVAEKHCRVEGSNEQYSEVTETEQSATCVQMPPFRAGSKSPMQQPLQAAGGTCMMPTADTCTKLVHPSEVCSRHKKSQVRKSKSLQPLCNPLLESAGMEKEDSLSTIYRESCRNVRVEPFSYCPGGRRRFVVPKQLREDIRKLALEWQVRRLLKHAQASKIQGFFRYWLLRKKKVCICRLQSCVRRWLNKKHGSTKPPNGMDFQERDGLEEAATVVQQWARMCIARKMFLLMRESIICLQHQYRRCVIEPSRSMKNQKQFMTPNSLVKHSFSPSNDSVTATGMLHSRKTATSSEATRADKGGNREVRTDSSEGFKTLTQPIDIDGYIGVDLASFIDEDDVMHRVLLATSLHRDSTVPKLPLDQDKPHSQGDDANGARKTYTFTRAKTVTDRRTVTTSENKNQLEGDVNDEHLANANISEQRIVSSPESFTDYPLPAADTSVPAVVGFDRTSSDAPNTDRSERNSSRTVNTGRSQGRNLEEIRVLEDWGVEGSSQMAHLLLKRRVKYLGLNRQHQGARPVAPPQGRYSALAQRISKIRKGQGAKRSKKSLKNPQRSEDGRPVTKKVEKLATSKAAKLATSKAAKLATKRNEASKTNSNASVRHHSCGVSNHSSRPNCSLKDELQPRSHSGQLQQTVRLKMGNQLQAQSPTAFNDAQDNHYPATGKQSTFRRTKVVTTGTQFSSKRTHRPPVGVAATPIRISEIHMDGKGSTTLPRIPPH